MKLGKNKILKQKINHLENEYKKMKSKYNEDLSEMSSIIEKDFYRKLINHFDDLVKMVEFMEDEKMKSNLSMIINSSLEDFSLKMIYPKIGERFDFEKHKISNKKNGDSIIKIIEVGYEKNGSIIKLALVEVGDNG